MSLKNIIITAFKALMIHRSRSVLTILGIVIGVAAIIIVMALGNGAQNLILDQISGLGAESVVLRPGKGLTDITSALYSQSLTQKDVDALRKKVTSPILILSRPMLWFLTILSTEEINIVQQYWVVRLNSWDKFIQCPSKRAVTTPKMILTDTCE